MAKVEMVKHFPLNTEGRDFAIGDIHGYFNVLDKVLEEVDFDKTKDRIFSVGDLVDRGPESIRFSDYIFEPWFHAVRGNHEQLQLQHHSNELRVQNGGRWFVNEWEDSQREIRALIGQLPVAIDVQTKHGLVGIVHANVPFEDWALFTKRLELGWGEQLVQYATWDRSRWRYRDRDSSPVENVAHILCGHCAHDEVRQSQNVTDLDTGCGYEGGKLTLWSIDDMEIAAEGTYEYTPFPEPVKTGW